MKIEFSLDRRKTVILWAFVFLLTFFSFSSGWFSSVLLAPEQVFPPLASFSVRFPEPSDPQIADREERSPLVVMTKEKQVDIARRVLSEKLTDISFPVRSAQDPVFPMVHHDGLWRKRTADGLFRMIPDQRLPKTLTAEGEEHWFTLALEVRADEAAAETAAASISRFGDLDSYTVPAFRASGSKKGGEKNPIYVVMAGDFPSITDAQLAAEYLQSTENRISILMVMDEYPGQPFRRIAGMSEPQETAPSADEPKEKMADEPPEEEPVITGIDTALPYSLRLACFNTAADGRRAVNWYAERKGIEGFLMKPVGSRRCGWVVYSGHFADKSAALAYRREIGLRDAVVNYRPKTVILGEYATGGSLSSDQAVIGSPRISDNLLEELRRQGYGLFHLPVTPSTNALFAGVFPDVESAEPVAVELLKRLTATDKGNTTLNVRIVDVHTFVPDKGQEEAQQDTAENGDGYTDGNDGEEADDERS